MGAPVGKPGMDMGCGGGTAGSVSGGRRCRGRRNLRVTLAFSINSCSCATLNEWQVSESNGMKVFGDALRTELHG